MIVECLLMSSLLGPAGAGLPCLAFRWAPHGCEVVDVFGMMRIKVYIEEGICGGNRSDER